MTSASTTARFDRDPGPGHPYQDWLPAQLSRRMGNYLDAIRHAVRQPLAPSVQALASYIAQDVGVGDLVNNACAEHLALVDAWGVLVPRIYDVETLLHGLNTILAEPPGFVDGELVGLPFAALMAGLAATRSGATLLRRPSFSVLMAGILSDCHANAGVRVEAGQWLSAEARNQFPFPLWKKDAGILAYWTSWTVFLVRQCTHPEQARAIADRASNPSLIASSKAPPHKPDVDQD